MAIYSLEAAEFNTENTLGGWYETAVFETTEEGSPAVELTITYNWDNGTEVILVLHGDKYGRKCFATNSPREWPEFDALFGRKEWQQLAAERRQAMLAELAEYDDE